MENADRVRANAGQEINRRLDREADARVGKYANRDSDEITSRN